MLGHVTQAFGAMATDVRVGANEYSHVAEEAADSADRLGAFVVQPIRLALFDDNGRRQERSEFLCHADRTSTRTSTAMGTAECLVWIEVHHVSTEIPRTRNPEDGVHIGAVQVHQATDAVDLLRNGLDTAFEQAQRVRVGDHEDCRTFVQLGPQVVQVDLSVRVALQV